jgi:outer membrane protein TolC
MTMITVKKIWIRMLLVAPLQIASQQTDTLTLDRCITIAIANNPLLPASRGSVMISKGGVHSVRSLFLPQISLSTQASQSQGASSGGTVSSSISEAYTTSVTGQQMIFDFGKTIAKSRAAQLLWEAATIDTQGTAQSVILSVTSAYYTLLQFRAIANIAAGAYAQAEAHRDQAKVLFDAGRGVRYTVMKAQVDCANAQLALVRSKNAIETGLMNLYGVMGAPMDARAVFPESLSIGEKEIIPVDSALQTALVCRPDLRASKVRLAVAQAQLAAAHALWRPVFSANGSFGFRSVGFDDPLKRYWSAGALISMPLYQGGAVQAQIETATGNLMIAQAADTALVRSVRIDIEQQAAALLEALQRVDLSAQIIDQAALALSLAKERFAAGSGGSLEVSDAEFSYQNAQINRIGASYDYCITKAKMRRAMGILDGR